MYFSDKMAEIIKEDLNIEDFETKEELISIKEEILPSSTVEDTYAVNLHKDGIKLENTEIQFIKEFLEFLAFLHTHI